MKKVSGFLDASGKQETLNDKILVVAASLATPFFWQEFSKEWIAFLEDKMYRVKPGKVQPTFHTTEFHYGNYPFREEFGWDDSRKGDLYNGLIELIKKRTEYSTATGVDLDDYRRFSKDYPGSLKMWANAGAFASAMCFWKCREWALVRDYDETISYVYDRGDTFAKELRDEYNDLCDNPERAKWWFFKPGGLMDKNKEDYIPLQSVDVVAWEVARHYKEALTAASADNFHPRNALIQLSTVGAEYKIYGYEDLISLWSDRVRGYMAQVKEDMKSRGIIKEDSEFDEDYARHLFKISRDELGKIDEK